MADCGWEDPLVVESIYQLTELFFRRFFRGLRVVRKMRPTRVLNLTFSQ